MLATLMLLSLIDSPPCANPYVEVSVPTAARPAYPESARRLGLGSVTVLVDVVVGPMGVLQKATIFKSSGNADIDAAALKAAQTSTYAPKLVDCQPATGEGLFRVVFNPSAPLPSLTPPLVPSSTLVPPTGWSMGEHTETSLARLTSWVDGQEEISMTTGVPPKTPDRHVQGVVSTDSAVRTCHGSQDARLISVEDKQGSLLYRFELVTVTRAGWQYMAVYSSSRDKPPDAQAMASLLSLCAP